MPIDNPGELLTGVGGAAIVGASWIARQWWKARSDKRADAVDSANANGQINMLADYERRAKEAEADADRERATRLTAERAQTKAESLQADAERELRMARRDLDKLQRRLRKAGIPDSDYMPHMETNFGALPPPAA